MREYAPGVLLLMIIMVMYSAITGSSRVLSLRRTLKMCLHSPASGLNPRFISSSWMAFYVEISACLTLTLHEHSPEAQLHAPCR